MLFFLGLITITRTWTINRSPSNSLLNPIETGIQFVVNVNDFELNCTESPEYTLNALPWKIKLCKSSVVDTNNVERNVLNASLVSPFGGHTQKWSCKAGTDFKLFPKNPQIDSIIVKNVTKQDFDSITPSHGIDVLVDWDTFLAKYVRKNEAKFEITISTDPPARKVKTEQTSIKFYIFAKNVTSSIFTSPKVLVRGVNWTVSTGKQGKFLAIYLHADENDMDPNETMDVIK